MSKTYLITMKEPVTAEEVIDHAVRSIVISSVWAQHERLIRRLTLIPKKKAKP